MRTAWKILALVLGLALSAGAHAVLTIRITQGAEGALPIAVVPFAAQPGTELPVDVAGIIAADLARSGRFKPMPNADMPQRPAEFGEINFQDWQALNMDNLVVGQVRPAAGGGYQVDFRLVDVYRAQQLVGFRVPSSAANLRMTAHHIADIIYEKLTGQKGAFATRIAYVTRQRGAGDERIHTLQVADSDGYGPQVLLRSSQPLLSPAWSPDGRRLAYVSFEGRRSSIYIQDVASGSREVVAEGPGLNSAPAWSPDGSRLALTMSREGNPDIYVMDLASRRLQRLTEDPAIDTEAAWMPDGRSLVFTSDRGGGPQIYQVSADGGSARRLTFDKGNYNARPRVSADGRYIAMVSGGRGGYDIAVLDTVSGDFRTVTASGSAESPSFAPNGSMLVYATSAGGVSGLAVVSTDGRVRQSYDLQGGGEVMEPAWGPLQTQR